MYFICFHILSSRYNGDKETLKLMSISIVSVGYGGDISETQANELLDDVDFYNNKVKCSKIGQILPMLNRMVREQQILIGNVQLLYAFPQIDW